MRMTSGIGVVPAAALASLIVVAAGMACDDSPSRNPVQPTAATPAPIVTRLELSGPGTVNLGESAQFTALAQMSDGSSRDVTAEAAWQSSDAAVMSVSERGLATGNQRGDASLSIASGGRTALKADVIVVPQGTYRVSGAIRERGLPILGAFVEVTRGPAAGLRTTGNGEYRLYGVWDRTEIRVRKDGYEVGIQEIDVTGHQRLDFELTPRRLPQWVAGAYTLKVSAAQSCRGVLPAEAWERTYAAAVEQNERHLVVRLGGAAFHTSDNQVFNAFEGLSQSSGVTFSVDRALPWHWYYYYRGIYLPEVLERLSVSSHYAFQGAVAVSVTSDGLVGTLDGAIRMLGKAPGFVEAASCQAADHSFALLR